MKTYREKPQKVNFISIKITAKLQKVGIHQLSLPKEINYYQTIT